MPKEMTMMRVKKPMMIYHTIFFSDRSSLRIANLLVSVVSPGGGQILQLTALCYNDDTAFNGHGKGSHRGAEAQRKDDFGGAMLYNPWVSALPLFCF